MRGQGRVYRHTGGTGDPVAVWWLDYSVNGKRYRESSGTNVKQEAVDVMTQRIKDRKEGKPIVPPQPKTLATYLEHHLAEKAKETAEDTGLSITSSWIGESRVRLNRAVAFLGKDRLLASIGRKDVLAWITALRGQGLSGGTVRHHINALSNLYRRAVADDAVLANPVAKLLPREKPKGKRSDEGWLEVPEAAKLLEAARTYHDAHGTPFAYELIATLLLTGGRWSEVVGLEVDDISLERKTVTFQPNEWRRLKTAGSTRTVPLWPQLEAILRPWFGRRDQLGPGTLLFPRFRNGQEQMLDDMRKSLKAIAGRAGFKAKEVTPKMFRSTYITARLQNVESGVPVPPFTVAKEAGHGSLGMVMRVYGKLGQFRARGENLEYRLPPKATARRAARRTLGRGGATS